MQIPERRAFPFFISGKSLILALLMKIIYIFLLILLFLVFCLVMLFLQQKHALSAFVSTAFDQRVINQLALLSSCLQIKGRSRQLVCVIIRLEGHFFLFCF